ncbi:MAG TPA: hypothetical protein VNG69_14225 [Casimicrobiaceae bacterium]|nr:hypothetical protein [Casimicrobiaceae bacterium]
MNRYHAPRSAPLIGLGAVLASCAVMMLAVYLPSRLPPDARVVARFAPIEVAIEPSTIEVVGIRSQFTAEGTLVPVSSATPRS